MYPGDTKTKGRSREKLVAGEYKDNVAIIDKKTKGGRLWEQNENSRGEYTVKVNFVNIRRRLVVLAHVGKRCGGGGRNVRKAYKSARRGS